MEIVEKYQFGEIQNVLILFTVWYLRLSKRFTLKFVMVSDMTQSKSQWIDTSSSHHNHCGMDDVQNRNEPYRIENILWHIRHTVHWIKMLINVRLAKQMIAAGELY